MKYYIKAAILDLDGVLTKTAAQHSKAWKMAFDEYNLRRKENEKEPFAPYNAELDYPKYIDGIPRYDGVAQFLESRAVHLPYGSPQDEGNVETICGIGNHKNRLYKKLITEEGVEVYQKNVEQIQSWKAKGIKTAVISSSKNCKEILETSGLEDLFEVRVDGITSEEKNIPGKPKPDIFLEAARQLGVEPGESLIVEDAQAGVAAGKAGGFRLVIGIRNASKDEELLKKGADVVVGNLRELDLEFKKAKNPSDLPSALKNYDELSKAFKHKSLLFFLDFDGTLSPIVEHHEDAVISEEMRDLVHKLSKKFPVAIVSGRGLADVKKRVALPEIFYAGSHGFEISGPGGFSKDHVEAVKVMPVFNELEPILKSKLENIKGVGFERKKFTLAVHYRQVKEEFEPQVHEIVSEVLKKYPQVKQGGGKKVIEIRPAIDWHKGKATEFLKKELTAEKNPLSVYIGDDVTDEDAFKYIANGYGILVGEHGQQTYADYSLKDIEEVKQFFSQLLKPTGVKNGTMES